MIYLDNAATTKMYEQLVEIYKEYGCQKFFNPSSLYKQSLDVALDIRQAKAEILEFLGSGSGDIIFTGSATEANNLAIRGSLKKNSKIVISAGEHPSVYNTILDLKNNGVECEIIPLQRDGRVDEEKLYNYLSENKDVRLVSIIHVSNETGAINNIKELVQNAKKINPSVLFHSDGVQAFAKIDVKNLGVDLYSISAHKIKGPKGIGALFIKKGVRLHPIITGGGQENNLRSGTENVANIIAFAKAAKMFSKDYDYNKMLEYRTAFLDILKEQVKDIVITTENTPNTMPHIISLIVPKIKGETLLHILESKGILIGLGSACSSRSKTNRVLQALGYSSNLTESSLRISFSPDNTWEEIKTAAQGLAAAITLFRK
ncbi:MAG TPA: cysteine desulfurase family protein [Clostridia bacterium]